MAGTGRDESMDRPRLAVLPGEVLRLIARHTPLGCKWLLSRSSRLFRSCIRGLARLRHCAADTWPNRVQLMRPAPAGLRATVDLARQPCRTKGRLLRLFSPQVLLAPRDCPAAPDRLDPQSLVAAVPEGEALGLDGKAALGPKAASVRKLVSADLGQLDQQTVVACGMQRLRWIRLPRTCSVADINGSCQLRRLELASGGQLKSLNLHGCRTLLTLQGLVHGLQQCEELNLGQCLRLPPAEIEQALTAAAGSLRSLDLRVVASDALLKVIVGSCPELRWVDLSFSDKLTDQPVLELIGSCKKIERMNLRGCRSVSRAVYNQVTMKMLERQGRPAGHDQYHYYLK